MSELMIKTDAAIQIAQKIGANAIIKPLEKEVFLKSVFVKDVIFQSEKLSKLQQGDILQLKRETQPYDDLIVAVFNNDVRIGELAEFDEGIFAHLLDAGKKLVAKVKNVVIMPEYCSLEISITMIDY